MKNFLLIVATLFIVNTGLAQVNEKVLLEKSAKAAEKAVDTANLGWKRGGNIILLFNQSAFNNEWLAGGTSSMAGNLGINYDFNKNTKNSIWDNKIILAYGLTKLKGQDVSKTDDRVEFTSLYGKKVGTGNWYYSGFLNFKTQMDSGFLPVKYTDDNGTPLILTDDVVRTRNVKTSHFFSPAYLQAGPGMLWKKSANLKVNIAPATSRLIFVHKEFTEFGSAFGVEKGKTTRFEFGAALNAYYKLNLMTNVSMENILNLYSNYLDNPQNVDVDYQMNLVMKVNKYMSANIALQTIYDDNAISKVQVRQVFGFGINYGF
jgi:Protein of unknown function (DUF3078)